MRMIDEETHGRTVRIRKLYNKSKKIYDEMQQCTGAVACAFIIFYNLHFT